MDQNSSGTEDIKGYDIEVNSITSDFISFGIKLSGSYTLDDIKRYTLSPMIYNKQLRKISHDFYNTNGQYHQVMNNQVSSPTLDYITTPIRKINKNTWNQREIFNRFIKAILHKRTTRDAIRTNLLDGFFVGILRSTDEKSGLYKDVGQGDIQTLDEIDAISLDKNTMIQPLNLDYCKIIGFVDGVQVAAFDMQYFDEFKHGGLIKEIKSYPNDFVRGYKEYKKDASKRWFALDPYKTMVLKFNSGVREPYGRPYCIAAMTDIKTQEDYEEGKNKVISELVSTLYALNLPEGKEKGTCSLNKSQQSALIEAVKNAVQKTSTTSKDIGYVSLPPGAELKNVQKDSSVIKDSLTDENSKKVSTSLAFAESALNGSSEGGASYASLQVNLDILSSRIFEVIERINEEYTRIFNYHLFGVKNPIIEFEYLMINQFNRKDIYSNAKELYGTASGSRRVLIATAGFNQDSYVRMMELEKFENMDEKFPPHLTSYTATDRADEVNPDNNLGGRPKMEDEDLSPSGQNTRSSGSNEQLNK